MKLLRILIEDFHGYIRLLVKKHRMSCLSRKWRELNAHNMTIIGNPVNQELFPLEKVKVGKNTYGALHVVPYNETDGNLIIGSYCSIAKGVKFLLGGNHDYKRFSTYPFKILLGWAGNSFSKGDIVISDDVWIGENAFFLSGVRIGQGAVIAANTLVSQDVKPYEIVGGNPMRHIKFRFSEKVISRLLQIDYNQLDLTEMSKNESVYMSQLDDNNIDEFMGYIPLAAIHKN